MEVGHTKFRPDEVLRSTCQYLNGRTNVLSMDGIVKEISNSFDSFL